MDKNILKIIKKLKESNKKDLAKELIFCESKIEQTDRYGKTGWGVYASQFIIYAPREKIEILKENNDILLKTIQEIYPPSSELEISFLDIRPLLDGEEKNKSHKLAESWIKRAESKVEEGENFLKKFKYAEAISAFQECIEFSIKSLFLLLRGESPKRHKFEEKEFLEVLESIPDELEYLEFHKIYLYSLFWEKFYTIAKYGLENFGLGAEKLFEKEEANLALKHAKKSVSAVKTLDNYLKYPW